MAKNKKENIVITDKELTPTIIGKLDTKEKSPILLIFIFIIFIAVAIFLPDITNYFEKSLKGNNSSTNVNPNNNININEEEEIPSVSDDNPYYDYTTELVITNDDFTMSNIVISENKIYFDLKNNKDTLLNLEDNKYFLEIYNNETTLLQRIKISYGKIEANSTSSYSYDLEAEVASHLSKLLLVSKTVDDYPEFSLTANESGIGTLTCTKNYETITYTFGNNQLTNINNVVKHPFANDLEYTTNLQKYQSEAAINNNYDGVSSTLITSDNGFVYSTLIDLQKADISLINNKNYYNYRTEAKVVKFETESNGFSCN